MSEYERLVNEFNKLSSEERNACLIYKSKLSYLINEISSVPDFMNLNSNEIFMKINDKNKFEEIFLNYKEIVLRPENLFIKMSIMNSIDFSNLFTMIDSLKNIYLLLISASSKMMTEENLKLYRIVSTNEETDSMSKGNIISTTLNKEMIDTFAVNKYNHLYNIKANSGIKALVIPYKILIDENFERLRVEKQDGFQQEVIIFKDDVDIEVKNVIKIDEYIKVSKISVNKKNKFVR